MLVLTMEAGDIVHIGDDIQIKVVRSDKRKGRYVLGFQAPQDVLILRDVVKQRIAKEVIDGVLPAHDGPESRQ